MVQRLDQNEEKKRPAWSRMFARASGTYRRGEIQLEDRDEYQDTATVTGLGEFIKWTRKLTGAKKVKKSMNTVWKIIKINWDSWREEYL